MPDEQDGQDSSAPAEQPAADDKQAEQGSLTANSYEAEDIFENAEPWDPVETKMVLYSFATAIVCLAIFGYLIYQYILP